MCDTHRREASVPALKAGESGSCDGSYLHDREYHPARLCAVRKSPEAEEEELRRPEAIALVSLAAGTAHRLVVVTRTSAKHTGGLLKNLREVKSEFSLTSQAKAGPAH